MQILPTISPAILPSVLSAENRHPAIMGGLPREGLSLLMKQINGVWTDTIGLPIATVYPLVAAEYQSIISGDGGTTWRDVADIITLMLASEYLNDGGEMGGSSSGYFIYIDGTDETILRRAYRWAGITWPETPSGFPFTFPFNLG